jgi:hypothetical protein
MMNNRSWSHWRNGQPNPTWNDRTKKDFYETGSPQRTFYSSTLYDILLATAMINKGNWLSIPELKKESKKLDIWQLNKDKYSPVEVGEKSGHDVSMPNRLYMVMLKLVHDGWLKATRGGRSLYFQYAE